MTNLDYFKSMPLDELADWLDKYGEFDGSPWSQWFDAAYCQKCESVICHYADDEREFPCAWCELEHKCKFFPDMDHTPDITDIIRMWLELESKEEGGMSNG